MATAADDTKSDIHQNPGGGEGGSRARCLHDVNVLHDEVLHGDEVYHHAGEDRVSQAAVRHELGHHGRGGQRGRGRQKNTLHLISDGFHQHRHASRGRQTEGGAGVGGWTKRDFHLHRNRKKEKRFHAMHVQRKPDETTRVGTVAGS